MRLSYYEETDSLYIDLAEKPSVDSREAALGIVLDFDEAGLLVGIDIDQASTLVDLDGNGLLMDLVNQDLYASFQEGAEAKGLRQEGMD